ncbi:hypothetical protein SRO_0129 [Streptomyces rochei]|nr:hypothetical protein SRO_0129 [Streptomyces rochei]
MHGSSNVAGIVSGTGPVWTLGAAVLFGTEKVDKPAEQTPVTANTDTPAPAKGLAGAR